MQNLVPFSHLAFETVTDELHILAMPEHTENKGNFTPNLVAAELPLVLV